MAETVLLTTKQAASLLSVSESFFRKHVAHQVDKIIITPRCVRYRVCDIEKYAETIKGGQNDKV